MLIVSFDIATEKMYIAIEKDGDIIASRQEFSTPEKYNSAIVIPVFVEIFRKHGFKPENIDLIVTNIGPGSFTGIRAGAVIARTLAQFLNIPVVGIPSLEIYAGAVNIAEEKYVVLDARRSMWYTGLYGINGEERESPELKDSEEVLETLKEKKALIITELSLEKYLSDYNPIYIQELEADLAMVAIKHARERLYKTSKSQDEYAWYNLKPVYLQTPSITISKKHVPPLC